MSCRRDHSTFLLQDHSKLLCSLCNSRAKFHYMLYCWNDRSESSCLRNIQQDNSTGKSWKTAGENTHQGMGLNNYLEEE